MFYFKEEIMRLIIVSNRLPVTIKKDSETVAWHPSLGGLATGLNAFVRRFKEETLTETLGVGWVGKEFRADETYEVESTLKKLSCHPVFLSKQQRKYFYNKFCNGMLWPLFHQLPQDFYENGAGTKYAWKHYQEVNQLFCEKLTHIICPDDIVWIHDFHLFLLPQLLRNHFPQQAIGFFLHIPFPSFAYFNKLPALYKTSILEGILGADLIGFHIQSYKNNFLDCLLHLLGPKLQNGNVVIDKRLIKLSAEPMGIDFQYFHDAIQDINIKKLKRKLEKSFALLKTMISVDRLDYTKGLVNKLQAYETFLSTYPAWRGRVSLILIVAPSREQLSTYQSIKKEVEQYVEQINFRFGTLGWLPVLYRYKSFTAKQLIVLYSLADVALITPLIDGMNLVAKEYVAVKSHAGVLILSETAGAAKELPEAILVNPNRGEEIVLAIKEALEMQKVRQFKALNCMQAYLKKNDVAKWGTRFIHMLLQEKIKQHTLST